MECHVIGYQGDRKSRDALQIGCFNHVTWRTALTATYWVMRGVALFLVLCLVFAVFVCVCVAGALLSVLGVRLVGKVNYFFVKLLLNFPFFLQMATSNLCLQCSLFRN